MNISEKFGKALSDIDGIFNTSTTLKRIYQEALKAAVGTDGFVHSQKNILNNAIMALGNVSEETIEKSEKENWNKLYSQGLILIVSLSEQFVRELFEDLVDKNLEKLKVLDKKEIPIQTLREKNFELTREDWLEIIKDVIYSGRNPEEKINLQNIQSIEKIYATYFNIQIDLDEALRKDVFYYYQVRHILIHSSGKVDNRFINNLKKAGVECTLSCGEMIPIEKEQYEDCKSAFVLFFERINLALEKSNGTS